MVNQTRIYSREYESEIIHKKDDPEYRKPKAVPNKNDTITKELEERCILLNKDTNSRHFAFLWSQQNTGHYISVSGFPKHNERQYTRKIIIETTPLKSELPSELAKILEEHKFK